MPVAAGCGTGPRGAEPGGGIEYDGREGKGALGAASWGEGVEADRVAEGSEGGTVDFKAKRKVNVMPNAE